MDTEKQARLKALHENKKKILYYLIVEKFEKLKDVAVKISTSEENARTLLTQIYKELGINELTSDMMKKKPLLIKEYERDFKALYPTLESITSEAVERGEAESEGASEAPIPAPDLFTKKSPEPPSIPPIISKRPSPPRPSRFWIIIGIGSGFLCISIVAIAILGGLILFLNRPGREAPIAIIPTDTKVVLFQTKVGPTITPTPLVQPTDTLAPTSISLPTNTPPPTSTSEAISNPLPTDTPTIPPSETSTLVPTNTSTPEPPTPTPDVYMVNQDAQIESDVYIRMIDRFINPVAHCFFSKDKAVGVMLRVTNLSSHEYLTRFTWDSFSAVDDKGREYPVLMSGYNQQGVTGTNCDNLPGVKARSVPPGGYTEIIVVFSGSFDVDTKYLIVTVKNLSGVGPIKFKKDV